MELRLLRNGIKFNIYAVILDSGECPAENFIKIITSSNPASGKSFINILARHADHGQILNTRKSRPIHSEAGIFEFKTAQGDRVLYFYDKGRKTILTHGFHKGSPEVEEFHRARTIKERYLREAESG